MSIISQVKLYAENLEDGGTYRGNCPECGRKNTFTVTKQGTGCVYNCFSAHCSLKGVSGVAFNTEGFTRIKSAAKVDGLKKFEGQLTMLSPTQKQLLNEKVGFTETHLFKAGVRFAPVEDRYAFPIFSPSGKKRGWVMRSYEEREAYKALTYMDIAEPHLSWYGPFDGKVSCVVVVEDIPSAVRASMHLGPVVAVCGGGIGPDYVRELRAYARSVVWAFDPDATYVAIEHHRRYGLSFDSSRVLRLEQDLKNMTESDLTTILKEI